MLRMDVKDLELLTQLTSHGRWDQAALSGQLGISPSNVERRIKLLQREGVIKGFSAFFDRRMFGYDTTFLKLHFDIKDMDYVIEEVSKLPQVASVYPNMDDFMIVEVVHWDTSSLKSVISALERIASPYTITDHFIPHFPDMVPETPKGKSLKLLGFLIKDGRADPEMLADLLSVDIEEVSDMLSSLFDRSFVRIKPVIQEDAVNPFPTFSVLISLRKDCHFDACYSDIKRISKESWDSMPLEKPKGAWLKCFGKDLHAMDMMLERFRRMEDVEDVMVILPDTIRIRRSVDLNMVKANKK
jgi:DNA-binding Lrp family transcriptional regulator